MLDKVILTSSFELAEKLASEKKVIVVNSNSLLGQLTALSTANVNNSVLPQSAEANTPEQISFLADIISNFTSGNGENATLHDSALDDIVSNLSKVVTNHIAIARTVVKPHVLDFMSDYAEYCNRTKLIDPAGSFNIVQKELPSLFEDESFIEQFKYYEGKMAVMPKTYVDMSNVRLDPETILKTGSARIDKMIDEIAQEMGPDFISGVLSSFITKNNVTSNDVGYSNLGQQNLYDAMYISLVLYLSAQKLHNNVPEGLDTSLEIYQNCMLEIRDFAGSMLNNLIKRAYFMLKSNTLILKSDSRNKTVYVQGSVYRSFIEQGGAVEMILGICATDSGLAIMGSILDNRDVLIKGWNSYCTFMSVTAENSKLENTKSYLTSVFNTAMNNLSDVEKEYSLKNPKYVETAVKLANDYIKELKLHDLDLVSELSLNLMANCRFFFTAGYQILSGIEQATKLNVNLDPREAALVSAVNYITDFLVDQTTIAQV